MEPPNNSSMNKSSFANYKSLSKPFISNNLYNRIGCQLSFRFSQKSYTFVSHLQKSKKEQISFMPSLNFNFNSITFDNQIYQNAYKNGVNDNSQDFVEKQKNKNQIIEIREDFTPKKQRVYENLFSTATKHKIHYDSQNGCKMQIDKFDDFDIENEDEQESQNKESIQKFSNKNIFSKKIKKASEKKTLIVDRFNRRIYYNKNFQTQNNKTTDNMCLKQSNRNKQMKKISPSKILDFQFALNSYQSSSKSKKFTYQNKSSIIFSKNDALLINQQHQLMAYY